MTLPDQSNSPSVVPPSINPLAPGPSTAPAPAAAPATSAPDSSRGGGGSGPVSVNMIYDGRESANQLASRLLPTLQQMAARLDQRFAGDAASKLAEASMGGQA